MIGIYKTILKFVLVQDLLRFQWWSLLLPSTRRIRSGHGPIWGAHMATEVVTRKITFLLSGPLLKWPKHKVALKMMLILLQGSSFGCWCFPEGICMFLYAVNWQLHLQLLILSFSNRWQVQETRQLTIPYQFDGSHDSWNSSFIFFYLFVFKWIDTSGWC